MLIALIMLALATIVSEQVMSTFPTWSTPFVRQTAELAAGMSLVALAFVIAQALVFLEELWWRP